MRSRNLTKTTVARIKTPISGRREYFDSRVPGFCLRVTSKGSKSWCFFYRVGGHQKRFTLGTYPAMKLDDARRKALEARLAVENGDDPQELKKRSLRSKKQERKNKFSSIAEEFIEKHAKKNTKSWKRTEYNLKKYVVPFWGELPLNTITRRDAISLIENISEVNGKYAATYVRANLRKLFSWACKRDLATSNPIIDVERPISAKKSERERVLSHKELKAIWNACDQLGYPFGPFIRLLTLTAQRRGEVAGIKYADINLDTGVWHLDKKDTKSDRLHDVPLSKSASKLIEELPVFVSGTYLFSTRGGATPISGFSKAKKALDEISKVENWRMHDIRRSVGTNMTEHLGVSEFIVGRVLNHAQSGVTSIYARASYMKEKRKALDIWDKFLKKIVKSDV